MTVPGMKVNITWSHLSKLGFLVALGLVASSSGCGGGGKHHGGGGGDGGFQTCAAGFLYHGDQAGGGDKFSSCVSHPGYDFSLTDDATDAGIQGTYQTNVTFANLLLLSSSSPSAGIGTAAEMQSAALLVNPGTLPMNAQDLKPVVLVSWQTVSVRRRVVIFGT